MKTKKAIEGKLMEEEARHRYQPGYDTAEEWRR